MSRSQATTRYPSSTGNFAILIPTGTIDGNNQTFVFSMPPSVIVIDNGAGGIYNKTNLIDSSQNWTGTTTVVLNVQAPNRNIYGY